MDWDNPMVRLISADIDLLDEADLAAASDVALEGENPYQISDWRFPKDYPAADTTDISQWRWEFLRRHPRYRQVWQAYLADLSTWNEKNEQGYSKSERIANRFGLRALISPANQYDPAVWMGMIDACQVAFIDGYYASKMTQEAIERRYCVVSIDPMGPLDDQLALIKKRILMLRKYHRPDKRWVNREHWQLYLRLLDAKDESHKVLVKKNEKVKATYTDILKLLGEEALHTEINDEEKVKTLFEQAEKLRDQFLFSSPHVAEKPRETSIPFQVRIVKDSSCQE